LGTPLNVISGRAAMIRAGEDVQENARIIEEQASRVTSTVRELLTYARRRSTGDEQCQVEAILAHTENLMNAMAERAHVEITRTRSAQFVVSIELNKALQVLTNLVTNAIQAMPKGGRVELAASAEHIDQPPERRSAPGHYARIDVRDQGTGIDPDRISSIFEPFFTTKGAAQGTGLGLSVCDGIVREHGGWIAVTSSLGQGSCFSVYLPQATKRSPQGEVAS
jgi:signal transduction histidine kinase